MLRGARRLQARAEDVQLITRGCRRPASRAGAPAVQAAIDLFDAEVTQVRPWARSRTFLGDRSAGKAMKGFGNLMKEAQKLQAELEALKEEVGKKKVEATAGGGMVTVEANGKQELVSIRIDREVITPDDPQMLEDLVLAAANEALRKARELVAARCRVAGGLGLKIPGLM